MELNTFTKKNLWHKLLQHAKFLQCHHVMSSIGLANRTIWSQRIWLATQCKCRIHLLFVRSVYGTGCLGKMMSTLNDTLHQLTLHQHTLHRPTFTVQQMTSTQVNVCKSWCLQYISYTSLIRHFGQPNPHCTSAVPLAFSKFYTAASSDTVKGPLVQYCQ